MQNTSKTQQQSSSEADTNPPSNWAVSDKKTQKRTKGLKILDNFIYTFVNNFAVFAISVYATYMTQHGDKHGTGLVGNFNSWLKRRGDKLMNVFKGWSMTHDQADTSKMVFFSFLDGSLLAPFIKLFEDKRESIAKGIDTMLGTLPEDESVYAAEPKQTWKSVLLGRLATAAIVVPTAVILEKQKVKGQIKNNKTNQWEEAEVSLNTKLFRTPGEKAGEVIEKKYPGIKNKFSKIDLPYFFRTSAFELFYTSVCTAGLYFSSRFIAKHDDKKRAKKEVKNMPQNTALKTDTDSTQTVKQEEKSMKSTEATATKQEQEEAELHDEVEKSNTSKTHVSKIQTEETATAQGINA